MKTKYAKLDFFSPNASTSFDIWEESIKKQNENLCNDCSQSKRDTTESVGVFEKSGASEITTDGDLSCYRNMSIITENKTLSRCFTKECKRKWLCYSTYSDIIKHAKFYKEL